MLFCHDGKKKAYQVDLLEAIRDSPKARTCLFLPSKPSKVILYCCVNALALWRLIMSHTSLLS